MSKMLPGFRTTQEMVLAAHAALSPAFWDYVTYGSESETAVGRNRRALDSYALKPRIMRDVSRINLGTTFLGHDLRLPVLLAPMGSIARFDPAGPRAAVEAAGAFGIAPIIASHAIDELETFPMRAAPTIYALHPDGDLAAMDREVERVAEAGAIAISFASQSIYYGRRDRDIHNDLLGKGQLSGSYAEKAAWPGRAGVAADAPGFAKAALSWDMLERVKSRSGLPLLLKGVQTAEDARLAIEHGVDVLYVSNNGGRALDHVRGTLDILPEIVDASAGRAEVIVDGGIVRGTDIIKALALGARAVCLGRLQAWALAAGGRDGLVRMLEILEEELTIDMGLLGQSDVKDLSPQVVERAEPIGPAHSLGAFPSVCARMDKGSDLSGARRE